MFIYKYIYTYIYVHVHAYTQIHIFVFTYIIQQNSKRSAPILFQLFIKTNLRKKQLVR